MGLAPNLIDKGVDILQYADGTVLCIDNDPDKALNLKLLLYMFEHMSGLNINFQKSEILYVAGDDEILKFHADLFNCEIGHFPIRYFGVPVSYATLRNVDLDCMEPIYIQSFDSWIGNAASVGGRLVLFNSNLSSISYYYM